MTKEEFESYLVSIGGLIDKSHHQERPNIISRDFFQIGDGWLQLVKDLISELVEIGWDREIVQIKEKFGGLRFYVNNNALFHEIIRKYEEKSFNTCQICAKPGTQHRGGTFGNWTVTVCDEHNKFK